MEEVGNKGRVWVAKLTAKEIVQRFIDDGKNLTHIEVLLQIEFGTLKEVHKQEGPAEPALETLLNIVYTFPEMIDCIYKR